MFVHSFVITLFCIVTLGQTYDSEKRSLLAESGTILYGDDSLSIGAFNVQIFGSSKMIEPGVLAVLVDCFRRWDIGLIQEIRESTGDSINALLKAINNWSGPKYSMIVSARSGRSASKEQYAFIYRTKIAQVLKSYDYADADDVFEREPFPVLFQSIHSGQKFFIIPLHSKPEDAAAEIDHLMDVYKDASKKFAITAGVIMGDLNADCSYLSQKKTNALQLRTDKNFFWLIGDDIDTTVATSKCAYDRIIVRENINKIVLPDSARVFRFDVAYGLSAALTKKVSDHYPVEFGLRNCGRSSAKRVESLKNCTIIEPDTSLDVEEVSKKPSGGLSGGAIAAIVCSVVAACIVFLGVVFYLTTRTESGYVNAESI